MYFKACTTKEIINAAITKAIRTDSKKSLLFDFGFSAAVFFFDIIPQNFCIACITALQTYLSVPEPGSLI